MLLTCLILFLKILYTESYLLRVEFHGVETYEFNVTGQSAKGFCSKHEGDISLPVDSHKEAYSRFLSRMENAAVEYNKFLPTPSWWTLIPASDTWTYNCKKFQTSLRNFSCVNSREKSRHYAITVTNETVASYIWASTIVIEFTVGSHIFQEYCRLGKDIRVPQLFVSHWEAWTAYKAEVKKIHDKYLDKYRSDHMTYNSKFRTDTVASFCNRQRDPATLCRMSLAKATCRGTACHARQPGKPYPSHRRFCLEKLPFKDPFHVGIFGNTIRYFITVQDSYSFIGVNAEPDGLHRTWKLEAGIPSVIRACEGMELEVVVTNRMAYLGQNLTIHWHGLLQRGTPFEDGPSQITQCPIKFGRRQVYKFPLNQHGTYWFHSHVGSQYTQGIRGALIIYPKEEVYDYDAEFFVTLSEWYHQSYQENEEWYLSPASEGSPPYPDSIIMNFRGQYNCTFASRKGRSCYVNRQSRPRFNLQSGKTHKLRLLNIGGWATFEFSIDGHQLQAVEVDGVDVSAKEPVDAAYIGAGQRYAFILKRTEFKRKVCTIRAKLLRSYLFRNPNITNINRFPEALGDLVTGVIYYTDNEINEFHEKFSYNETNIEPAGPKLEKVYLSDSHLQPLHGLEAPNRFNQELTLRISFGSDKHGVRRGSFNSQPFHLPTGKPLLLRLLAKESYTANYPKISAKFGDIVQIVVNNPLLGAHPIHVHGHHFWVLRVGKEGDGNYNPKLHSLETNAAMRDTAMVKERSHLVIRLLADNPGVWAIHCHIDWHAQAGMLAILEEAIEEARNTLTIPDSAKTACADHGIFI